MVELSLFRKYFPLVQCPEDIKIPVPAQSYPQGSHQGGISIFRPG